MKYDLFPMKKNPGKESRILSFGFQPAVHLLAEKKILNAARKRESIRGYKGTALAKRSGRPQKESQLAISRNI